MRKSDFIEINYIPDRFGYGTGSNYASPTKNRKYIKILAICLSYASPAVIYPGVKNPLSHQLHDLWKNGYLAKYHRKGNNKNVYYKTTNKGIELIIKALEHEMN